MTETKNSARRNFWILGTIVALITIFVFFQTQIDSRISNHPKVVTMEITQGHIQAQYDELKIMLKDLDYKINILDKKMNQLLREEYP